MCIGGAMIRVIFCVAGLLVSSTLWASTAEWTACFSITDDAKRLACYDAYAGDLVQQDPSLNVSQKRSESWFGLTKIFERSYEPESIMSPVVGVRKKVRGQRILTLENGQIWVQTDSSSKPRIRVGDHVRIRKASMGSFLLTRDGNNKSIRVRRVE